MRAEPGGFWQRYTHSLNDADAARIFRTLDATPVFRNWIESLNDDERTNAADALILAFTVPAETVLEGANEARMRRRRNRPRIEAALNGIDAAITALQAVENTAGGLAINHLGSLRVELSQIFIEKNQRKQKSNWQDWARHAFSQLGCGTTNREGAPRFSKQLMLREVDYVAIIQANIGLHVSRAAVQGWLRRESINAK